MNGRTNGQPLLKRCDDASKNRFDQICQISHKKTWVVVNYDIIHIASTS